MSVQMTMSATSRIFMSMYLEKYMFNILKIADIVTIEIIAGRCCIPIANNL